MGSNDSWNRGSAYIHVGPYEVVVGDNPGGSGHTDNAGTCTPAEFMDGRFNDEVVRNFDEDVLKEVRRAAGFYVRDTVIPLNPEDQRHLDAWKTIPIDESLLELAETAQENGYRDNFGYGPNGSTELKLSDNVTLSIPQTGMDAVFMNTSGSVITKQIRGCPALAHKGYAYLADIGLDIYDVDGELVFTTGDVDEAMTLTHGIGSTYRITNVLRNGDVILAEYSNYFMTKAPQVIEEIGMGGYFRVTTDRGLVSRVMKPIV